MKTKGLAVFLVFSAALCGAKQEKKKTEISLFNPFTEEIKFDKPSIQKIKVRKPKTTVEPKTVEETTTSSTVVDKDDPAGVARENVDFEAGGLTRKETVDAEGNTHGSYSYTDPLGKLVVVRYLAGKDGYKVLSDTSKDILENVRAMTTESNKNVKTTTTDPTKNISNEDWIKDIKRRTTKRTTTTTTTTTTTATTTTNTNSVFQTSDFFPPTQQLPIRAEQTRHQQNVKQRNFLAQRLFTNSHQPDLGPHQSSNSQFSLQQQFSPKQQSISQQQQFQFQQQFVTQQEFTSNQQFVPQQQFSAQQQFASQQQFSTQHQLTPQQQLNPQQNHVQQQHLNSQQQFASPRSSLGLEQSVRKQQLSHEQFLENNQHRLFVQPPQQQPFSNSPQFNRQQQQQFF